MSNTQTWDPERYARNARFVSDLGMPVVQLLAPRRGERILDLGCGDGVLAAKLAEMGCEVVGVDASEMQVAAARKLGVDARVMAGAVEVGDDAAHQLGGDPLLLGGAAEQLERLARLAMDALVLEH